MAKEFAKSHRVFYINHPYSIKDYFNELENRPERKADLRKGKVRYEKDDRIDNNFTSVIPPLTLPINTLPKGGVYNWLSSINQKKVLQTIQQVIEDFDIEHYVYMNCYDPFFAPHLKEPFKPLVNVYQSIDDISQDDYTVKHGLYLEEKAVADADLTLVTSSELFRLKSKFTDNIHVVNNAADFSNFQKALDLECPRPKELENIKGKMIGYVGNLDELRVDYPLLKKVAQKHSDKTLVLVGPINNTIYKEIGLDKLPNVVFTGGKSIELLPAYLRYFDCALIPFLHNTLTRSIYPLKINEYLAAGKAVVATNFSKDIESFGDHIYLAKDDDTFVELVGKAVDDNSPESIASRVKKAKSNTWRARIEQFWKIVNPYLLDTVGPQTHEPVDKEMA